MPRMARVVVPGFPHHIIQRGNRKQLVFIRDGDKEIYLKILTKHAKRNGIEIWAYCLMDNHVHLIAVPRYSWSLARGLGMAHKEYSRFINFREGWRGYLWQGRFSSFPMNEIYLFAAMRYVEQNPVKAGIVKNAEDYQWTSAKAHVEKIPDPLLSDNRMIKAGRDWATFLRGEDCEYEAQINKHASTGRPLGDDIFIAKLELLAGRVLRKMKTGPKPMLKSK